MTIPRLKDMTAYWARNPPLHLMVAAYLGVEDKSKSKNQEQDMNELVSMMGMSTEKPEWLKTIE